MQNPAQYVNTIELKEKSVEYCKTAFSYILSSKRGKLAPLVGTYYGMARASVCLSVCLSVGLSRKLVNTIQTELFQLGPSNFVYILLMTRGRTLLIFKVMGQRSRSHTRHLNLVNKINHFYIAYYNVISLFNSPLGVFCNVGVALVFPYIDFQLLICRGICVSQTYYAYIVILNKPFPA